MQIWIKLMRLADLRRPRKLAHLATAIVFATACLLSGCRTSSTHLAFVSTGNGVFSFRIDNNTGAAKAIFDSPFVFGSSPFGIVVHPSNQFAFIDNQGEGTISLAKIDEGTGTLKEQLPRTQAGIAPGPMVMDSGGNFLFVADQTLNQVIAFSVGTNGSLSQVSTASVGLTPSGLALSSSSDFLFVPVPGLSAIYVFAVNSGSLTQVCASSGPVCSPFIVPNGVGSVAVDPAGGFLYVPNPSANTLSGFAIQSDGSLVPVPDVAFGTSTTPVAAAIDPGGHFLYLVSSGTSVISQFSIDSEGDLTALVTGTVSTGTSPGFVVFDPDKEFIFVANLGASTLSEFTMNSNGSLNSTSNTVPVGSVPRALAFTK